MVMVSSFFNRQALQFSNTNIQSARDKTDSVWILFVIQLYGLPSIV